MKTTILATLIAASLIAFPAFADTPNRTKQSFADFAAASGCIVKDNAAGQSNLYSVNGGACDPQVQVDYTLNNGADDTNGSTVPGL